MARFRQTLRHLSRYSSIKFSDGPTSYNIAMGSLGNISSHAVHEPSRQAGRHFPTQTIPTKIHDPQLSQIPKCPIFESVKYTATFSSIFPPITRMAGQTDRRRFSFGSPRQSSQGITVHRFTPYVGTTELTPNRMCWRGWPEHASCQVDLSGPCHAITISAGRHISPLLQLDI